MQSPSAHKHTNTHAVILTDGICTEWSDLYVRWSSIHTCGVARVLLGQQIAGCPTGESAFPRRNITPVSHREGNLITLRRLCVCVCVCSVGCTLYMFFFMTHIDRISYLFIYQSYLFLIFATQFALFSASIFLSLWFIFSLVSVPIWAHQTSTACRLNVLIPKLDSYSRSFWVFCSNSKKSIFSYQSNDCHIREIMQLYLREWVLMCTKQLIEACECTLKNYFKTSVLVNWLLHIFK